MVAVISRLLVFLLLAWSALAAPVVEKRQGSEACTTMKKRRSWHTLSEAERKEYINAELCLMKKPAKGMRGAKTRFDELQSIHVFQAEIAHFVGTFLPFHRLFMYAHEQLLEQECGYTAGQPYWNESVDAGRFSQSIILDPVLGFGGDGVGAQRCIQDGPFASYVNSIGPGYRINDHCIQRQISDRASATAAQANVDNCMRMGTYVEFWRCVEGAPHSAGHGGVGQQMLNPISSPGDPLFYMHHTWLDGIWARWQDKDQKVRFAEVGGNNRPSFGGFFPGGGGGFPGFPGFPGAPGLPGAPGGRPGVPGAPGTPATPMPGMPDMPDMPNMPGGGGGGGGGGGFGGGFGLGEQRPADVPEPQIIGDPADILTLTHLIEMYGLVANRTVAEVMDTRTQLCYEYD